MARNIRKLRAIKALHTAIWAFFVACILGVPAAAWLRRFDWALALTAIVLLECAALGFNGGRCPLTGVAARYTADRRPAFDIYLPEWLARRNKAIFGTLFVLGEALTVWRWVA